MNHPQNILYAVDALRFDGWNLSATKLEQTHAALVELVAADRAHDEAQLRGGCVERADAALRRRKALEAFGGAL